MKKKLSLCLLLILICVLCMSSTAAFAAVEATDETGSQVALDQSEVTFSSTQKQVVHVTYTGNDEISYDIVDGQNLIDAEWSDCWSGDTTQLFITRITDNEGTAKIKIYPTDKKNDYKVITVKLNVPSDEPSDSEKRVYWQFVPSTGALMIYGNGEMADYTYGQAYGAYIRESTFVIPWQNYRDMITKVEVGPGITRIGNYNFAFLDNLKEVKIANTVEEIGEAAFAYCGSLKKISLPDSVKKLGFQAFFYCSNLKKVDLNKVEYICEQTFSDCSNLTKLTIPETVKTIETGYTLGPACDIKFKSSKAPEFAPSPTAIQLKDHNPYANVTYAKEANIYIPAGANKEDWLKQFNKVNNIYKATEKYNFIEYDDTAAKDLAKDVKIKVSSAKLIKGTKITAKVSSGDLKAIKDLGYNVTYKYYRSTKKTSGYVLMKETKYSTYKNTSGKKGTKYYYKALIEITDACGDVIYTGSAKEQTPCSRTFK